MFAAEYLDQLIEEATVDAYNESEQTVGFFTMMDEHLAFPFTTWVLGQEVTIAKVDITGRDQIVAVCLRGKETQAIPILNLPMPVHCRRERSGSRRTAAGVGSKVSRDTCTVSSLVRCYGLAARFSCS
jgi:hypothetical protein